MRIAIAFAVAVALGSAADAQQVALQCEKGGNAPTAETIVIDLTKQLYSRWGGNVVVLEKPLWSVDEQTVTLTGQNVPNYLYTEAIDRVTLKMEIYVGDLQGIKGHWFRQCVKLPSVPSLPRAAI